MSISRAVAHCTLISSQTPPSKRGGGGAEEGADRPTTTHHPLTGASGLFHAEGRGAGGASLVGW